jgi:hypothetical protein
MNVKNLITPYWLRNKRDTVQNTNIDYTDVTLELEEIDVLISEQIVDSDGNILVDSDGDEIMEQSTESQYEALIAEYDRTVDSDDETVVDDDDDEILSMTITRQKLVN